MEKTQQQDQAILRISYLLASLDGNVSDDEKKIFRKIAESFSWFTPGGTAANNLLNDVISASEKLIRLKGFYSEQEFLTSFLTEIKNDYDLLKEDRTIVRKGFAIWIAMCMADKDFSAIERAAIKILQEKFNGKDNVFSTQALGSAIIAVSPVLRFAQMFSENANLKTSKGTFVEDSFLKKTEDLCITLGSILERIEAEKSPIEKKKLENAYHTFETELHELIIEGEEENDSSVGHIVY